MNELTDLIERAYRLALDLQRNETAAILASALMKDAAEGTRPNVSTREIRIPAEFEG